MIRSYSEEPTYSFIKRISNISQMILLLAFLPQLSFSQCSGTIYDSGGSGGNYPNNSNVIQTYTAPSGSQVVITLTSFNIESGYDYFRVYDGASTSSTQLASLTGSSPSQTVFTSTNGALTIRFTADNIINAPGYAFTLSCVADVPACNSNELTNGNFDNGSTGWTLNGNASISSSSNDKVSGAGGLKLDNANDNAEQSLSALTGQTIDVSFYGKTSSSGGNAFIKLQYLDNTNTVISESTENISNSGSFAPYSLTSTVPANTSSVKLIAERNAGTSSNAYFDEICVEISGSALIEICDNGIDDDGDLLIDCEDDDCGQINGRDFNSGTSDWFLYNQTGNSSTWSIDNTSQLNGVNSAYINITADNGTDDWHTQFGQGALDIVSGKTYSVTFDARAVASKPISISVQLDKSPWTSYDYQNITIGTTKQTYTYSFNANATVTDEINLLFNLGNNTTNIFIDNVQFKEVCQTNTPEICNNGIDDDGDNLIDEYDPDCGIVCFNDCTTPYTFSWSDASGSGAVWEITNGQNSLTRVYPISGALGTYNVSVTINNPDGQNIDFSNCGTAGNHFYTATCNDPNAGANCDGDPNTSDGQFSYGCDFLTFGITSDNSTQSTSITYDFEYASQICNLEIGDIDFRGSGSPILESWQDEIDIVASNNGTPVAINAIVGSKVTVSNNNTSSLNLLSIYDTSSGGDLDPYDTDGHALITTLDKVTSITFTYSNGPDDEGQSDDHAIRINGFEFCPIPQPVCTDPSPETFNFCAAGQQVGDVSSNDNLPAGGYAANYTVSTGPTKGTVSMSDDGTFTYLPNSNATGTDQFKYERCYSVLENVNSDVLVYNPCGTGKIIETFVEGIEGEVNPSIDIGNTANINRVIVEVWTETSCNSLTIEGVAATVNSVSGTNGSGQPEKLYRAIITSVSSDGLIDIVKSGTCPLSSAVAYVEKIQPNIQGSSFLLTSDIDLFHANTTGDDCLTNTMPIGESDAARDIVFTIPLHEKDNTRVATATVVAGGVTASGSTSSWSPTGQGAGIIIITLSNVPASANSATITVCSPDSNGDSFGVGIVSANNSTCNESSTYDCCSTATATINLSGLSATITSNGEPCLAGNTQLTANVSGAAPGTTSYAWSGPSAFTGNTQTINVNTAGNYQVTVMDGASCFVIEDYTVHPAFNPTISANKNSICLGESATLSISGSNIQSIAWSASAGGGSGSLATVSPNSTTTYSATVTSTQGCTASKNITVVVNPSLSLGIDFVGQECLEDDSKLSTIITGGTAPFTYNWVDPSNNILTTDTIEVEESGNFYVTVTDDNGCSDDIAAFVYERYDPFVSTLGTTVCEGESIDLSISTPATAFLWGANAGNATTSSVTVLPSPPSTTYTVTVTNTQGCTAEASAIINADPKPVINYTGAKTVCEGLNTQLTPTSGGVWTSSNTNIAEINNSGYVTAKAAGKVVFTFKNDLTDCVSNDSDSLTVLPKPTVSVSGPRVVCEDAQSMLSPTSGGTWESSNDNIAEVTDQGVVTAKNSGTATFTFTNAITGCISDVTESITINERPVAVLNGSNILCEEDNSTVTPNTGGVWTSSKESIVTVTNTGLVTAINSGTAKLIFENTVTGCQSDSLQIDVIGKPKVSFSGPTEVCEGFTTGLSASIAGTWRNTTPSIATIQNDGTVTGLTPGVAKILFDASNGCVSDTAYITINEIFIPSLNGVDSICIGTSLILSPSSGGSWQSSDENVATVTNAGVVTGVDEGTATFTFTSDEGCVSNPTSSLFVEKQGGVTITGDNALCIGETTDLDASKGGGTWISGDLSIATVNASTGVVTAISPGIVTITYDRNSKACSTDPSFAIEVFDKPTIVLNGGMDLCMGESIFFTTNIVNGVWTSSNETVALISSTGVVTPVAPGTATFRVEHPTSGCQSDQSTTITVNPAVDVNIDFNGSVCLTDDSQLTALPSNGTPNYSYVWSGPNGYSSTLQTIDIDTNGNYYVTITDSKGCSDETSAFVYERYDVSILSLNTEVCEDDDVTLSVSDAPGQSYLWSANAGNATTNEITVIPTFPSSKYEVTITNDEGCSISTFVDIDVKAKPIVAITGPDALCEGDQSALSPTTGGFWTSNNNAIASVNNTGVVTGIAAGSTTFAFQDTASQCISDPTAAITVADKIDVNISGPVELCEDGSGFLTADVSGGKWFSSNPGIASIDSLTGEIISNALGSTIITYTFDGGGCYDTGLYNVSVINTPTVSFTGPSEICEGLTTNLSPISGGTWVSSDTTVAKVTDQGVVTGVGAGSALFTFTSDEGCVGELLTALVVTASATVSVTGASGICQGFTTSLSPTTGGVWVSNNNAIATVSGNGTVLGHSEGVAIFTFYEATNGCPSQETIEIEVFAKPTTNLGSPGDICVGSQTAIIPNTGGSWESNNSSVATILDDGTITAVGPGDARFIFTDGTTGCKSDLSAKLTVLDLPSIDLGSSSDICIGSTINVSPTTGGTWSSSNPTIATVENGVLTAYNTGTVTFTFFSDNGGCNSAESQPITVGERPSITFDGGQEICIGATTKLTAGEPGIWASSNSSIATITADGTIIGVSPGTAKFVFTTADGICSSDSSDVIQVLPRPTISLQGDSELCIGSTTNFIPNVGGEWTSSNPAVADINNAGEVLAKSPGTVQFTYKNNATQCTSDASLPITIYDAPTVLITGGDSICIGSSSTLSPNSGGIWTSSDFSKAIVSSTGLVTGISPGEVTFTFTNNANNCSADIGQPITILPNPVVTIDGPTMICEGNTTSLSPTTGGQWVSNNPSVATVSDQGIVQGLSQGIAKFVFTSDKGCSSIETGAIIVIGKPNPVFIGSPEVCIGGQMNILPNTGGSWSSSDASVASITNGGLITGLKEGAVQFTFTDTINGCVSDPSADLTVNGKPVITVPTDKTICIGESFSVAPTGGGTWYSTNPAVAQINNSGTVLGLSAGSTRFYYQEFNSGCTSDTSAIVTVEAIGDPQLNGSSSICVGDTTYFLPTTGGTWESTNDAIATISNTGMVIGLSGGIVRFKYINAAGCESNMSTPITVYDAPVVGLLGSPLICEGSTTNVFPSSGGVWMSSDTSVAVVTNSGIVFGKKPGTVNLTFVDNISGCSSTGDLEVVVQLPPVISILGSADVCVDYTTLLSTGEQGLWVTSDDRIATVGATGLVTAWTPGKVSISFISMTTGCESEAVELNVTKCTNHDFNVTLLNTVVSGDLSTNDIGPDNAVYSSSTILISKPTASNGILTINNDGTYTFEGDQPGKYIYEVQICTPPNTFGCPTTVLEITVVGNQFTDNTPVSNLEFTTTFGNALITLPGDQTVLRSLSNDGCVRSAGCTIDLTRTVINNSALDGINSYDDNGNITYTPNIGKLGRDELSYTVCVDEVGTNCSTSKMYVTIASPSADNSIVAADDFASTISTSAITGNVMDNDSDPEGDAINVVAQGDAANPIAIAGGSYFVDATGAYTFTPEEDFNGPTSFTYTVCDDNGDQACMNATVYLLVFGDAVNVNIRVYLEGAMMNNGGETSGITGKPLMRDDLRSNAFQGGINIIPVTDPYSSGIGIFEYAKKTHVGPGLLSRNQVIMDSAAVFSVTGDDAIVDWVFLEIRNKNNYADCLATRSALVQRDGDVVDLDGISPVTFQSIGVDSFYLVIRHRNHLGVMSGLVANTDFVDFTDPETEVFNYGVHPTIGFDYTNLTFNTELLNGYNCLWAGDANSDGLITFEGGGDIDVNVIQIEVLLFGANVELSSNFDFVHGYFNGDYNMDGKVKFTNPNDDTNMLFSQVLLYDLNSSFSSIFVGFIEQVPARIE